MPTEYNKKNVEHRNILEGPRANKRPAYKDIGSHRSRRTKKKQGKKAAKMFDIPYKQWKKSKNW